MNVALNIAKSNEYSGAALAYRTEGAGQPRCSQRGRTYNDTFLRAFYLRETKCGHTHRCIRNAALNDVVRVIHVPPTTLKRQLAWTRTYYRMCSTRSCVVWPNGKEGDCMKYSVVFLMTCNEYGENYSGETGRFLCVRTKEHLGSLREGSVQAEHRVRCHEGAL